MKHKVIKIILVMLGVAALSAGCLRQSPTRPSDGSSMGKYDHTLRIGNKSLQVEIVDTEEKMRLGLSGRTAMADDQGMLFDFGKDAEEMPSFWMKDMNFDLDIIWIKDGKAIGITKKIPASVRDQGLKIHPVKQPQGGSAISRFNGVKDSELPIYSPPSPIDAALEVNAGWAERNNIGIGDAVILNGSK